MAGRASSAVSFDDCDFSHEFAIVVLAPFLFDSIVTLARRIAKGERWYAAHRSHYYQRLVVRGLSHAQVTALYAALAVIAALAALAGLILDQPLRQALAVAAYHSDILARLPVD